MADLQLLEKIHTLSDLELAALLCLIAREHCLISTDPDSVDELAEELRLVASRTFGLTSAVVDCHSNTTLDDFANSLFISPIHPSPSPANTRPVSPYRLRNEQHQQHQSQPSVGPASSSGSYFSMSPQGRITGLISPIAPSFGAARSSSQISQPRIANVVLAKDLDRAPRAIQIQALELLRTRRIFTRTSVQTAPKQFLFIALVGATSASDARVTPHLNDFLYLSHRHDPEEHGFPYLDEQGNTDDYGKEPHSDDTASLASRSSVVKSKRHSAQGTPALRPTTPGQGGRYENSYSPSLTATTLDPNQTAISNATTTTTPPLLTEADLAQLSLLSRQAHTSIHVLRYQANLVAFLRAHRALAPGTSSGATPTASRHLEQLCRSLAVLHGLTYVTPSLVALALPKVFAHRLRVVRADDDNEAARERSMQWGSDLGLVKEMVLEGLGAEEVCEEVLGLVKVPC
jgi:hypothetical protein